MNKKELVANPKNSRGLAKTNTIKTSTSSNIIVMVNKEDSDNKIRICTRWDSEGRLETKTTIKIYTKRSQSRST